MESFTIFTSSDVVDHIILYYFLQQDFAKWGTEIAFEISIETEIIYCSSTKMFYVTRCEFYGRFLHQGWAKFSSAK